MYCRSCLPYGVWPVPVRRLLQSNRNTITARASAFRTSLVRHRRTQNSFDTEIDSHPVGVVYRKSSSRPRLVCLYGTITSASVDSQRAAAGASQIKIRGNAYGPDLSLAQVLLLVSMRPRRARVAFRLLGRAPNKPVEQPVRNSSMSHYNGKPQPSQVHTYSALTICQCCKCCSSFHPGPSDAPWIVERIAWATYTVGMIETAQYVARNPGPSVSRRCEQESGNVYAPRLH